MELEQVVTLDYLLKDKINGKITSYSVNRLTASGENFLSLIYKVVVKCIKRGYKPKVETLELVAKCSERFIDQGPFNSVEIFQREVDWYSKIVPELHNFAKIFDVSDYAEIYPIFYGAKVSDPGSDDKDILLLEKVEPDFKMFDRHVGFDYDTTKSVLNYLAKFHALPISLKLKKPTLFQQKILPLLDPIKHKVVNSEHTGAAVDLSSYIMKPLTEKYRHDEVLLNRCRNVVKQFPQHQVQVREPWATNSHNDFWVNNILIKKDRTKKSTKVKILDFQLIDYRSLASDLIFFLFTSVKTSLLKTQLFDELVKYYYDQLIINLKQFNIDTSKDFSYEDLLREIELEIKGGEYGHIVLMLNITFGKKFEKVDLNNNGNDDIEVIFKRNFSNEEYIERLYVITEICTKKGWI